MEGAELPFLSCAQDPQEGAHNASSVDLDLGVICPAASCSFRYTLFLRLNMVVAVLLIRLFSEVSTTRGSEVHNVMHNLG